MSVTKAREYLQRYAEDEEFRSRIQGTAPDGKRKALEEAGFGDQRREHVEQAHSDHVDGVDLDDVSGGTSQNMAAMYMEAMMAFYTTNSSDMMNKGNEM